MINFWICPSCQRCEFIHNHVCAQCLFDATGLIDTSKTPEPHFIPAKMQSDPIARRYFLLADSLAELGFPPEGRQEFQAPCRLSLQKGTSKGRPKGKDA